MKKIAVTIGAIGFLIACNSIPEGYVVNGELQGNVENGTKVFLKMTDSLRRTMIAIDTAVVENGQFTFSGAMDHPQLRYITIDGVHGNAPIILENGQIHFKAQKDSLSYADLKGTLQNEIFMTYMDESRKLSSMSRSMNDEFRKANASRDTAAIQALREEYLELQERANDYELDFVKENPNALISVLVLEKLFSSKTLPVNKIDSIFQNFDPEIKSTESGKRITNLLKTEKATAIGVKAPEFSGPAPDGNPLALNDVKGKMTLIDFWAAWCRPCRKENPNIVSVYQKYKDKGLSVVGISLDRKKEDWLGAIESDGLEWNHISHLQYFQDPIAQLYNVNAIPAAFLLDENGVIVGKNLRGSALEAKVAEFLDKK